MIRPGTVPTPVNMTRSYHCPVSFIGVALSERLPCNGLLGQVIAVFDRAAYLETTGGQIFCIADIALGEGPLTIGVYLSPGCFLPDLGVSEGTPLEMTEETACLGRRLLLPMRGATVWRPPLLNGLAPGEEIRWRLKRLTERLQRQAPADGLAPLLPHVEILAKGELPDACCGGPTAELAMPRVSHLTRAMKYGEAQQMAQAVSGLMGLGPGLTPSGDDLLAGLMVALKTVQADGHLSRASETAFGATLTELDRNIMTRSCTSTNKISAAMLEQATRGLGSASQHRLLLDLLAQADSSGTVTAARRLTRTGHSSGWDSLVGLLLGVLLSLNLIEAADALSSLNRGFPSAEPVPGVAA